MATRVDWDEIAGVLLEKRFYLTALELHTELLEGGRENRKLGDFFSNPGNFESATPSSLARPSSDLCERASPICFSALYWSGACASKALARGPSGGTLLAAPPVHAGRGGNTQACSCCTAVGSASCLLCACSYDTPQP